MEKESMEVFEMLCGVKQIEKICKKTGLPIKEGYCDLCMGDTEERENKSGCD